MDDTAYGTRNKRGDWAPKGAIELPPLLGQPFNVAKIIKWIPGYLFPWNAFHMAMTLIYWAYVIPDVETMRTIGWGWALWLYCVNAPRSS